MEHTTPAVSNTVPIVTAVTEDVAVTDEIAVTAVTAPPLIEIAPGNPENATSQKTPRRPRLVDHVLLPATPWRVAPAYLREPQATENFIRNVKAEILDPRAFVFVADAIHEFLCEMPTEGWDVTRDVPVGKPLGDIVFWEWRDEALKCFSGALCKGVVKRTLDDAITEFETIQAAHFDYDVALVLESAHKAAATMPSAEAKAPVQFLTGTIFRTDAAMPDPKRPQAARLPAELRVLGSFALTMRADSRPVPGTLSLMLWDDESASDPKFQPEKVNDELYHIVTELLIMHTLMRAPEVQATVEEAEVYESRTSPFANAGLAPYYKIDMGKLPKRLREEGFAAQDGLRKALFYMGGRFAQPPVVWKD